MTNHNVHSSPLPQGDLHLDAGVAAETEPRPELGHLVKGLDYSGVVEWAKGQEIPGYKELNDMVGSKKILIDGLPATVGWVRHRPSDNAPENLLTPSTTPVIEVGNPGGEDVVLVEGTLVAHINPTGSKREDAWDIGATSRPGRPGFLQFNGGSHIWLTIIPRDQEEAWYVCFYPEAPEAQTPAHS